MGGRWYPVLRADNIEIIFHFYSTPVQPVVAVSVETYNCVTYMLLLLLLLRFARSFWRSLLVVYVPTVSRVVGDDKSHFFRNKLARERLTHAREGSMKCTG